MEEIWQLMSTFEKADFQKLKSISSGEEAEAHIGKRQREGCSAKSRDFIGFQALTNV